MKKKIFSILTVLLFSWSFSYAQGISKYLGTSTAKRSLFISGSVGYNLFASSDFGLFGPSAFINIGASLSNRYFFSLGLGTDDWYWGWESHHKNYTNISEYTYFKREMISDKISTVSVNVQLKYYFSNKPTRWFINGQIGYVFKSMPMIEHGYYKPYEYIIENSYTGMYGAIGFGIRVKDLFDIYPEITIRNTTRVHTKSENSKIEVNESDATDFTASIRLSAYLFHHDMK